MTATGVSCVLADDARVIRAPWRDVNVLQCVNRSQREDANESKEAPIASALLASEGNAGAPGSIRLPKVHQVRCVGEEIK